MVFDRDGFSNCQYAISTFLHETHQDVQSPSTSSFFNVIPDLRDSTANMAKEVDEDEDDLKKLSSAFKQLSDVQKSMERCQTEMVRSLECLGTSKIAIAETKGADPNTGTALFQLSVAFNSLTKIMSSLTQCIDNSLVFPLDKMLKDGSTNVKECAKSVNRSVQLYQAKFAKLEKEKRAQSKEAGWDLSNVSHTALTEELAPERTNMQFDLCQFYLLMNKQNSRKGLELIENLILYHKTVKTFFQDGLKVIMDHSKSIDQLAESVSRLKDKEMAERKALHDLQSELVESPHLDATRKPAILRKDMNPGENGTSLREISGTLLKRSAHKLNRQWNKRRCRVEGVKFYVDHSDTTKRPTEIDLLMTEVKKSSEDKKQFSVMDHRRHTYQFQAESPEIAQEWIKVIKNVQSSAFCPLNSAGSSSMGKGESVDSRQEQKELVLMIKALAGNDVCADCGSDQELKWFSSNVGSILCIDCAGVHRNMGVNVSRIKGLMLDTWNPMTALVALAAGNSKINGYLESGLKISKLNPGSDSRERSQYIREKYIDQMFVDPDVRHDVDEIDSLAEKVDPVVLACLLARSKSDFSSKTNILHKVILAQHKSESLEKLAVLSLLISNGGNLKAQTSASESTVFHTCIQNQQYTLLKYLLAVKPDDIDLSLRNSDRKTPLELALTKPDKHAAEIIESAAIVINNDHRSVTTPQPNQQNHPRLQLSDIKSMVPLSLLSTIAASSSIGDVSLVEGSVIGGGGDRSSPSPSNSSIVSSKRSGSIRSVSSTNQHPPHHHHPPQQQRLLIKTTNKGPAPGIPLPHQPLQSASSSSSSSATEPPPNRTAKNGGSPPPTADCSLVSGPPPALPPRLTATGGIPAHQHSLPSNKQAPTTSAVIIRNKPTSTSMIESSASYKIHPRSRGVAAAAAAARRGSSNIIHHDDFEDDLTPDRGGVSSISSFFGGSSVSLNRRESDRMDPNVVARLSSQFNTLPTSPSQQQTSNNPVVGHHHNNNGGDNNKISPPPPPPSSAKPRISYVHHDQQEGQQEVPVLKSSRSSNGGGGSTSSHHHGFDQNIRNHMEPKRVPRTTSKEEISKQDPDRSEEWMDSRQSIDQGRPTKPTPRPRMFGSAHYNKRCRALFDCIADHPDELSFQKGDIILVTKNKLDGEDDSWMEGQILGQPVKRGMFPATYVTFEK